MSLLANYSDSVLQSNSANNSHVTVEPVSGEEFLNAALTGNDQVISDYLLQGGNINIQNNSGNTALHIAAQNKSPSRIARILVHNGADGELMNNEGQTAMQVAQTTFEKSQRELKTATKFQRALKKSDEELMQMSNNLEDFSQVKEILELQQAVTKQPKPTSAQQLKSPTLEITQ